jgi:hypothetical protein
MLISRSRHQKMMIERESAAVASAAEALGFDLA